MTLRHRTTLRQIIASFLLVPFLSYTTMFVPVFSTGSRHVARAEDDVTPPTVAITTPTAGATVSGTFFVAIDATDDVGISTVTLALDGTTIADPVSGPPYSFNWDTTSVVDGGYTLTATATDGASNATTSEAVSVTVDNTPDDVTGPIVTVTSPAADTTLYGSVNVSAEATDPSGVASVLFFLDGNVLGEPDGDAPYLINWNTVPAAAGSHSLTAQATDTLGNTAASPAVTVNVEHDTAPPTATVTQPIAGSSLTGPVTIAANAQDNIGVESLQFFIGQQAFGPRLSSGPFTQPWDTGNELNGCYKITAQVWDASGNTTVSPDLLVVVNHNPPPPPGDGDTNPTSNVTNTNDGEFQNCTSTSANTGYNTANGHDTSGAAPVPITTGSATAGTDLPSVVNTNVTEINGSGGSGNGDTNVDVTVDNNNQASLGNQTSGSATTGNNSVDGNADSRALITTGDANIFTTILNAVNTNIVDSNFSTITDTFVDLLIGNINFLELLLEFIDAMQQRQGDTQVNLTVNNTSDGQIENNVEVNASTGSNSADGNRFSHINTGDINVGTNIMNLLNTNIVGSNWLFSTINVLGSFIGDIILPGEGVLDSMYGDRFSSLTINNDNQAEVVNSVNVNGVTGENDGTGNRDGSQITTGDVNLQTSVLNTVNTNIIGANFFSFLPHIFGSWTGGVVNHGGNPWDQYHTGDENGNVLVSNSNDAVIHNNLTINASTGRNTATGNRAAFVNTGDINVATNLLNVANTNVIGSNWFFGHFNVFGSWQGNIVYAYPDLAVTNANEGPTALPGDEITYQLHYRNLGLAPAKNVRITDTIPANTTFVSATDNGLEQNGQVVWELGKLPANSPLSHVSFTVRVNPALPVGQTLLNNAVNIATVTPEPVTANNTSGSQISVTVDPPPVPPPPPPPDPRLSIRKWNDAAGAKQAGQVVNYYVEVLNTGNVPLSNILVQDVLPGKTSVLFSKDFPLASLDVGQTMHITYALTVSSDTSTGVYTNTAVARAVYGNTAVAPVQASSSVTVTGPTTPASNPSLTKTTVKPAPKPALVVKQTNNLKKGNVQQGGILTFVVTIFNQGKEKLKNVVVTAKMFAKTVHTSTWKIGDLPAGKGVRFSYSINLLKNAPLGKYRNELTASGVTAKKTKVGTTPVKQNFTVVKSSTGGVPSAQAATNGALGKITTSKNRGLLFFDNNGRAISAYKYAQLNKQPLLTVLQGSGDPIDQQFMKLYRSGLTLVGKRGKDGTIITANSVLNELRKISRFKYIFGTVGG